MWIRRLFFIFIYISSLMLTSNLFGGVCYADIIPVAEPTRYTQSQIQSAPAIIKTPTVQPPTISQPQQATIQQPVKSQPQVQQQSPVNEVIPVAPKVTLKVNSINFDNSDSIIFLGTSAPEDFNDIRITKKVLSEPNRVFFDIENAIITFPNSTFELKNSRLTKVRIAQNSVEPKIVRLVIWNSENYDATNIKLLKIKNNLIIKLSNEIPLQKYLTQIYKESKESSVEYNDNVTVIQEEKQTVETSSTSTESDEIFDKVQQAFKEDNQQLVRPNIEQKQARLKSRFFLEKVVPKSGNLLLSGIGVINVQKPFILTEPSRIVFDLPNTVVLQELRDKEIKISETETAKIGQFSPSVARIVIKTSNPDFYRPVYSTNLQTLLIANKNKMLGLDFSDNYSELSYFKEQNINSSINIINMMFSKPIVYSIQREQNYLNVIFYNLFKFDVAKFNSLAMANKTGFIAKQLSTNIYKFSFPVKSSELVDCYETLNTSQLRFVFTKQQTVVEQGTTSSVKEPVRKPDSFTDLIITPQTKKEKTEKKPKQENLVSTKIKNKRIVIDAGHGGNDTGAIKNKIYEKDLTLEIAQRVRDILKARGLKKVYMTRDEDKTLSLADRVDFANNKNADIYVSIHINASVKTEINGIETHYYTENGYNVAKIMHKELMDNVEAEDRGLFKSKFYVINHTEAPAVLLELGFISNDQERNALTSTKRQEDSANAIAEGIINYLMEQEKD